jgi:hypothetical protein
MKERRMRRLLVVAGACGLLAMSSTAVFAKPPERPTIKSYNASPATNPCTDPTGITVGQVQLVKRGKSGGGGQYNVQVKLTNGAPSTTYDILVFEQVSQLVVGVPTLVCTQTADKGDLKTNRQGKGVANIKQNITTSNPSETLWLVLRDKATSNPTSDLGTGDVVLTNP